MLSQNTTSTGGHARRAQLSTILSRRWSTVAVLAVWTCAASSAGAVAPLDVPPVADLVVQAGAGLRSDQLAPAERIQAERPVLDFSRASHSRWSVLDWASGSLTPRLAAGTGVEIGGTISDQASAVALGASFVQGHSLLFQSRLDRLGTPRVRHALGKWSVRWEEVADGLPILGSYVEVLLTDQGRLAAFGAAAFPMITGGRPAALGQREAVREARAHLAALGLLPQDAPAAFLKVEGPFVLPVLTGEGASAPGAAGIEGRTVWRVRISCHDPIAAYAVDLDAVTGQVLQRRNILRTDSAYFGTATGAIENPSWCDGASTLPAPRLVVTVIGAGSDTADAAGNFSIPAGDGSPRQLTAEMLGAFCDVYNEVGNQARYNGVITPNVPYSLYWDDVTSRADERDTYYHVTTWHDRLKGIAPDWTDMDYPLPANVNLQQSCNAFWDGAAINMFHQAGNCANTGQIGDIIVHEYTHGTTDFMYGPNDPPSDMHEGNSDVASNAYINSPIEGAGFYTYDCVNGIRNSDNDMRWPDDLNGEGHHDGQIISGFHWHARAALIQQLGYDDGARVEVTLWHYARELGLPHSQPEQVWWNFLTDDDNGNLDDGTPHWSALCQAATRHGFSCPQAFTNVVIHHTPMYYAAAPNQAPIPVVADMYSLSGPLNPDSLLVYYRTFGQGPFHAVPFVPTGQGDTYQALIPGQLMNYSVDYYILAVDAAGNRLTEPEGPGQVYTFKVAYAFDQFEADNGWTVGAPGDNATTGIWTRCDPVGTWLVYPLQPEDDATPDPGHVCYITGQYTGGAVYDSDANGITTLLSPVYDLTGMIWATVHFDRWFQSLNGGYGYMNVDVSYDGGAHWRLVDHVQGMDPHAHWTAVDKDVTPQFGQLGLTRFRVAVHGDSTYSITEGGFDDFVLTADSQGSPDAVPPSSTLVPAALSLRLVSANPSLGPVALEYSLPARGAATLALYRVDGTLVRTLLRGDLPEGRHRVGWDGKDESGRKVCSGVYFARLRGGTGAALERIVVER